VRGHSFKGFEPIGHSGLEDAVVFARRENESMRKRSFMQCFACIPDTPMECGAPSSNVVRWTRNLGVVELGKRDLKRALYMRELADVMRDQARLSGLFASRA
jgi:hypothetical protein